MVAFELLEHTNDAIIIWEMEGAGILYWNQAAEQLCWVQPEGGRGESRTISCEPSPESPSKKTSSRCWPATACGWVSCATRRAMAATWKSKADFPSCLSETGDGWCSRSIETSRTVSAREVMGAAREVSLSGLNLRVEGHDAGGVGAPDRSLEHSCTGK